jgi:hypothetical protein
VYVINCGGFTEGGGRRRRLRGKRRWLYTSFTLNSEMWKFSLLRYYSLPGKEFIVAMAAAPAFSELGRTAKGDG